MILEGGGVVWNSDGSLYIDFTRLELRTATSDNRIYVIFVYLNYEGQYRSTHGLVGVQAQSDEIHP